MLTSRIATSRDYKQVARLCRRAVGPGDYALEILNELIEQRGLFLASSGGELVGITNFARCIDGSGWLGTARTDPDWRGRRVAVFLQRAIASYARKRGIRYLRFWTLYSNRAAIRAGEKGGFRPICEAVRVSARARKSGKSGKSRPVNLPSRIGSSSVDPSILASPYIGKMHGYFAYNWHFVRASKPLIRRIAQKGELYHADNTKFVLSKTHRWGSTRYANFTLLDGPALRSFRIIRNFANRRKLDEIGAYIPHDRHLLTTAKEAGLRVERWGTHCVVFEKKSLKPSHFEV